jgi:hypothetical protein
VCEVLPALKFTLQNIETNLGKWAALEDEYEELKENGNKMETLIGD